ncbi:expressed unknown protein [Seminavis robusta]|uniref:Uncharacterized protein n=1 Tax=Seminavis robusta TaxID=568900 RepID=A0A9N8DHQ1_9STRA|nr:expressed unknown protein [Seminavis robusta]|eukprot:Sro158_g071610.1 n/a (1083) ;mRNA; f:61021-64269
MSASTSVQGQQKLNKNLKTLKSGIRGMMLGGLSSARPVVAMGPEDKRPEAREDNIRDGEDEEELNIDDLATVPRVVDNNNNNEGSMDLTESASGLRTSLHIKQQKALEEEEQGEEAHDGHQRQRSVKRHDSPRGAEDWAGVSGSTTASSTHNNSQQAPPQDLSLMVGSDPNIYYKEAAAASPLSPVASAVGPLKYPTSAPIQMQTGTGYAPNGVPQQQQQSLSQTSHSLHNSQQQQPPPTSSMNKFLRGKIKISALKNLVVNPLDLSSTSAHHTSSKQQQQQQSLKSSVKQSRIDESDIVDHSRRHNDDDHHDDNDTPQQPQQKKLGGKARKLMRNSIIGLKNLGKVSTNRNNVILLEDDTSTTFSNAQDSLPPLKSMADTKYAKPVEEQPNQDLLDQGVAQLHVAKSVFHENEQAKQRRRKRVAKRNTNIGDYLLTSSTTSQPSAAELEHFSVGTEERRSKSKPKLDPQARERLKRHSRQREERYRSSANRRRRRHMADHSSRGSVMSVDSNSKQQDSAFMDRMSVSDRLSSVGRLSVHTTTTNDRLHSSEGQLLDHAAALEADDTAAIAEPKAMPLRAPSGGGDHHPPQSSNRKLKKEQDGKLRERVRSRQSLAMQHAKEPSFSALELLAQDDDESFADDIDQSVGSMEEDDGEHQYHDEDDDHDDGDVFAAADEARHHQEVSLKDIFSSGAEQPHLASSSAYTVDSVSANVSLDVTAGQGSFQQVEGARSHDYLQLVIGDNVPAKLASPTTAKEGEDAESAPVVVTKPERKMVRRRSKTRLTEDEKHSSSKRSSSRPSSGMRREGSSRRLAAGDKKEQRRSKPKSSSRRRTKSPRRKSDQTGTRRRKISARDSMGNASEPAITCTNTAFEESAENLTHSTAAAEEEQVPVDTSARTQDGDANEEREGSGSGNREAPQIGEPAGDPVADAKAAAEPSDVVASSNKDSRREEGGRDHNKESRKRQPRSGKEKRSVDRKPKKSSNKSGGSDEKHKHRPSSTRGRDGTKKHRSSTRGRSEAGKRESRGDRGQTRRRHSLDARKRLSSTAHHVDTAENAAGKKDSKPLDPQDKKFSASLADIKW